MEKMLIVDSIEAGYARCETETGGYLTLPLETLPTPLQEGDCLVWQGDAFQIDPQRTENRRKKAREQGESLWE